MDQKDNLEFDFEDIMREFGSEPSPAPAPVAIAQPVQEDEVKASLVLFSGISCSSLGCQDVHETICI